MPFIFKSNSEDCIKIGCFLTYGQKCKVRQNLIGVESSMLSCVWCITGVEVRDGGYVVIDDSEVTHSGSQGLIAHAGALGYVARR